MGAADCWRRAEFQRPIAIGILDQPKTLFESGPTLAHGRLQSHGRIGAMALTVQQSLTESPSLIGSLFEPQSNQIQLHAGR